MTGAIGVDLIAPEIKVSGTDMLAADLEALTGLTVALSVGLPGRLELHFADIGYAVSTSNRFKIGAVLNVGLAGATAFFAGEVTGVEMELDAGVPNFTVVAHDHAYRMTLGNQVMTYTSVSYSDIVSDIARRNGLRASVDSTGTQYDYVLQADSDFGFVSELANRLGYDWWVNAKTLNFKKANSSTSSVTLTMGENMRHFSVQASALHPGETTVTGWDVALKQAVTAQGPTAAVAEKPDAALVVPFLTASDLASQAKLTTARDSAITQAEALQLAARATDTWVNSAVIARGTCLVNDKLVPGGRVVIADAGPASGTYRVREVRHTYGPRGFETRFTAGSRAPRSLADTLAAPRTSSFRRDNLVVGIVTAIGNTNGSPGDVKVKYPGVNNELESNWARIVNPGGGKSRGLTFMPEINDEVVLGFENGDPRRPIVLGGLFNGKDAQPAFKKTNGQIDTRQMTSRKGHTIEFGDGDSDEDQYIGLTLAGGNHQVKLGKTDLTATVPAGTPMTLKSGSSSIVISNSGEITLTGKKITLKADTDVELSGVNVKAAASAQFSAQGGIVQIKSNGTAEVSASGPVAVKGAIVQIN